MGTNSRENHGTVLGYVLLQLEWNSEKQGSVVLTLS